MSELSTVFSADFLDLIYLHIVFPPGSTFAAIRFSVPTLNLFIIVAPTSNDYIIFFWENCPTLGQKIITIASSNQQSNTNPSAHPSQSHLVAHTVKRQSTPKNSSFKPFNIKSHAQETQEHPYSVITTAKSADKPHPIEDSRHFTPQSVIPYPPSTIKVKRKNTKRKHNNNNNPTT